MAPAPSLASAPALIGSAWQFMRKQRAFIGVFLWLLVLPDTLSRWLDRLTLPPLTFAVSLREGVRLRDVLGILFLFVLTAMLLWGWSCVLFLGRRMVQNKAGRSRSSFRCVRRDALPLVLPLLFTSILQGCFVVYCSLLFVIPALLVLMMNPCHIQTLSLSTFVSCPWLLILLPLLLPALFYAIRTSLYGAVLSCEEQTYRAALRRSSALTKGHVFSVAVRLLLLALLLEVPAVIINLLLASAVDPLQNSALPFAADLLGSLASSGAFLLLLLSTIALFGSLRDVRTAQSVFVV